MRGQDPEYLSTKEVISLLREYSFLDHAMLCDRNTLHTRDTEETIAHLREREAHLGWGMIRLPENRGWIELIDPERKDWVYYGSPTLAWPPDEWGAQKRGEEEKKVPSVRRVNYKEDDPPYTEIIMDGSGWGGVSIKYRVGRPLLLFPSKGEHSIVSR